MITIISGIAPCSTGTGRFLQELEYEKKSLRTDTEINLVYTRGEPWKRDLLKGKILRVLLILLKSLYRKIYKQFILFDRKILNSEVVILVHHQRLRGKWCEKFLERRKGSTWLYLMDSGFFCIKSLNHKSDMNSPCLACLGGKWENIDINKCSTYPETDKYLTSFLKVLRTKVKNKEVKLIAQNKKQAELARMHFGEDIDIKILGMWTIDLPKEFPANSNEQKLNTKESYDIVFHGNYAQAKGAAWTLEIARLCPEYSFLFPFPKFLLKL